MRLIMGGKRFYSAVLAFGFLEGPASLFAVVVNTDVGLSSSATLAADLLTHPGTAATGWVEVSEGAAHYRGTGVLVADNWVLTAAHNWDGAAVTALNFHFDGVSYAAESGAWWQNPGWSAAPAVGLTQGWDVALFRLITPVVGVTPARIYSGASELGANVTFMGAGLAGTASTGPGSNSTPSFYAGTNAIDRVITWGNATFGTGGLLAWDFDDDSALRNTLTGAAVANETGIYSAITGATVLAQSSSASPTGFEATSAAGDSGAPVFADFGNGPELIGLVSWGVNPSAPANLYGSGYGDITYLTRLAAHRDWIYAIIPEPAETALMSGTCLFLLTIGIRRRRR